MVQIGLMIEGQNGLNWARWQRLLRTAEDCGYQCVFRSDHFTNANGADLDSLELWVSLTYAATHTRRIEFGSLVAPTTFRHPAMTARMAAQVADLSDGRLILGLGAGWQAREHQKFGIPFYDFTRRYELLTDALELTQRLFESAEPVTWQGKHFALHEAQLLPRSSRRIPLLIGGNGAQKTLPLVAQYADEWNAVFITPSDYMARTATLNELLAQRGCSPASVKRSLMTQVVYGKDEADLAQKLAARSVTAAELQARGLIVGTGSALVEQIGAWAARGVQRFMLQWLDLDDLAGLENLARDVLPQFTS
jgi:alkanesulfonate monooxygenase SsuD/methylene tetrahydromethanopterin reductase-like flavin-dependent oxidoreductase (luciferase family)